MRGEGKLANYNPEIGSRIFTRRREMTSSRKLGPYNFEDDFFEDFNLMKLVVEEIYEGQEKANEGGTSEKVEPVKEEGRGNEGGPLEPSSPSFSSSSSSKESKHPSHKKKSL